MPFAAILTVNIASTLSSLAVTGDTFCYSGHANALYQWQGP